MQHAACSIHCYAVDPATAAPHVALALTQAAGLGVLQLLQDYYRSIGAWPQAILFYRDGVSEGQFKEVKEAEYRAIQQARLSLLSRCLPAADWLP
jgi:hypothetical protein